MARDTYNNDIPNESKKQKKKKNKKGVRRFLAVFFIILLLVVSIAAGAVVGFVDNSMDLIAEEYNLDFTSIIYYVDEETNHPVELDRVHRAENRVWVDIEVIMV